MKKLILILAIAFVAFAARGQTATVTLAEDITYYVIENDYTLTNTTVMWFQWTAPKHIRATQDYQVNLDSLTGDHTNIAIKLFGKKFTDDSWTQIGETVNSTGSASHSETETISNTAINGYRFYKAEFTGTGTGTTKIDWQKLKIWRE